MDVRRSCEQLREVCDRVSHVRVAGAAPTELRSCLRDIASGRAMFDAIEAAVARELMACPTTLAEKDVADAQRTTLRQGERTVERVTTLDAAPALGDALGNGGVLGGHVDALTRAMRGLDDDQRKALTADDAHLANVATNSTIAQFDNFLRNEVRRLDTGVGLFEQQRANTQLKTWVDAGTGMVCIRGEFDPERGKILLDRLSNDAEAMFHEAVPADCPTGERQQPHLLALALLELVTPSATDEDGQPVNGRGQAQIDMAVVVDHRTLLDGPHDDSIIDCGNDIHLPVDTIRRLACIADVTVLTMRNGVVLDHGRTLRTANRAQRRALRAMYPRCALFGCQVEFRHCKIHHIVWWRHLGLTDIANLVPLCTRHHHMVHEGGWHLTIDRATRVLHITDPFGHTHSTGPPRGS